MGDKEQPANGEQAETFPTLHIEVLPSGELRMQIEDLAPWAVMGICDTIKLQMERMTLGGQQPDRIQRAPAGVLAQLGKH